MAGDWIKVRTNLIRSPKIVLVARLLRISKAAAKILFPEGVR